MLAGAKVLVFLSVTRIAGSSAAIADTSALLTGEFVTQSIDNSLLDGNLAADGTLLALGQTGLGASRCLTGNSLFGVTQCGTLGQAANSAGLGSLAVSLSPLSVGAADQLARSIGVVAGNRGRCVHAYIGIGIEIHSTQGHSTFAQNELVVSRQIAVRIVGPDNDLSLAAQVLQYHGSRVTQLNAFAQSVELSIRAAAGVVRDGCIARNRQGSRDNVHSRVGIGGGVAGDGRIGDIDLGTGVHKDRAATVGGIAGDGRIGDIHRTVLRPDRAAVISGSTVGDSGIGDVYRSIYTVRVDKAAVGQLVAVTVHLHAVQVQNRFVTHIGSTVAIGCRGCDLALTAAVHNGQLSGGCQTEHTSTSIAQGVAVQADDDLLTAAQVQALVILSTRRYRVIICQVVVTFNKVAVAICGVREVTVIQRLPFNAFTSTSRAGMAFFGNCFFNSCRILSKNFFVFGCVDACCVPGHQAKDHHQGNSKAKQTLQHSVHSSFFPPKNFLVGTTVRWPVSTAPKAFHLSS